MFINIWNYFCILSNTRLNCSQILQIEAGHFIFHQNLQLGKFHGFMLQRQQQRKIQQIPNITKTPRLSLSLRAFSSYLKVRCHIMIYFEPQHCCDRSISMPLQIYLFTQQKEKINFISIELFYIITGSPQSRHSFPCETTLRRQAQLRFHASSSPKQSYSKILVFRAPKDTLRISHDTPGETKSLSPANHCYCNFKKGKAPPLYLKPTNAGCQGPSSP